MNRSQAIVAIIALASTSLYFAFSEGVRPPIHHATDDYTKFLFRVATSLWQVLALR